MPQHKLVKNASEIHIVKLQVNATMVTVPRNVFLEPSEKKTAQHQALSKIW
jgi:protein-L-isoaspartate O-methyltransferase